MRHTLFLKTIVQFLFLILFVLPFSSSGQVVGSTGAIPDSITRKVNNFYQQMMAAKTDAEKFEWAKKAYDACDVSENLKYGKIAMDIVDRMLLTAKDTSQRNPLLRKKLGIYDIFIYYYQTYKGNFADEIVAAVKEKIKVAQLMKDRDLEINLVGTLGEIYHLRGDYVVDLELQTFYLKKFEQRKDDKAISRFVTRIGLLYGEQGDTVQAMSYLNRGLEVEKRINDTTRLSRAYFLTGIFYLNMNRLNTARGFLLKSLHRYERIKDTSSIVEIYRSIATSYFREKKYLNSIAYQRLALEIVTDYAQRFGTMEEMGIAYFKLGNFKEALRCHLTNLEFAKKIQDPVGIGYANHRLARTYFDLGNYGEAKRIIEKMNGNDDRYWSSGQLLGAEETRYKIDSAVGDTKGAFLHYQQFVKLKNQTNNDELKKAGLHEKFSREIANQKKTEQARQETLKLAHQSENHKKNLIISVVLLGMLILIFFSVFVVRLWKKSDKQKHIIEEKSKETELQKLLIEQRNLEINDSIHYAQRIQNSLLPPMNLLESHFPHSFVLYLPKDIVSGDFYWFETVGKKILLAAVDCTGHGVPGAMVSVIGHNGLNRVVKEFGIQQPAAILDKLNELVDETFSKSEHTVKDGMDISLISYDPASHILEWAGANNPLWIIRNGQLLETKADKQPIGQYEHRKSFTAHRLEILPGDLVYLFSDGFSDQFSSEDKKLMTRKFKELLLSFATLEPKQQREELLRFHSSWKGDMEQTDDILVIGIRF